MREYFRANLWPNTPDILPFFLQQGGRGGFLIRATLAATLSSDLRHLFRLRAMRKRGSARQGGVLRQREVPVEAARLGRAGQHQGSHDRLNRIRRENRAMQQYANLRFHVAENDAVLFYSKTTTARDNIILVVVSLDPWASAECFVHVPVSEFGWLEGDNYQVHDLLTDERYLWTGSRNFVRLTPENPAHVFRVRRWVGREQNVDHFM